MSGILDTKKRIMDSIITLAGKRQMASGRLRFEFASFTDSGTFYEEDVASGSSDASSRIFFEATSRNQDSITFETDDSGKLLPIRTHEDTSLTSGEIFSKSSKTENYGEFVFTSGSGDFSSLSEGLISGSLDSFRELYMIGSRAPESLKKNLRLSRSEIRYSLTDEIPFPHSSGVEINIDAVEPLFVDKRLSHLDNFKFLPPVFPPVPGFDEGGFLGDYINLNEKDEFTYSDLLNELSGKESFTVEFESTSTSNNIVMQMFETGEGKFIKLDVIDFGEVYHSSIIHGLTEGSSQKRVFFIGKVFLDSLEMPTFVNLFTMVLE